MIIYPTGTCFADALEHLQHALVAAPYEFSLDNFILVHAIIRTEDAGRIAHAWLERRDLKSAGGWLCYFDGYLDSAKRQRVELCASRTDFAATCTIVRETRYTPRQVWEMKCLYGHFGPWDEEYRRLTKAPS